MKLTEFYNIGHKIEEVVDPYTYLSVVHKKVNYRLYSLTDLIHNKIHRGDISEYVYDYIGEQGKALVIFNIVNGSPLYCVVRGMQDKKFLTMGDKRSLPYGVGELKNFKYGSPLVIVEGLKDRDIMSTVYPNVVATLTAGAGQLMRQVLLKLTNNFLFVYDNDEAGQHGYFRLRKFLLENGCRVQQIKFPEGFKDVGQILDFAYKGDLGQSDYLRTLLKSSIECIL